LKAAAAALMPVRMTMTATGDAGDQAVEWALSLAGASIASMADSMSFTWSVKSKNCPVVSPPESDGGVGSRGGLALGWAGTPAALGTADAENDDAVNDTLEAVGPGSAPGSGAGSPPLRDRARWALERSRSPESR